MCIQIKSLLGEKYIDECSESEIRFHKPIKQDKFLNFVTVFFESTPIETYIPSNQSIWKNLILLQYNHSTLIKYLFRLEPEVFPKLLDYIPSPHFMLSYNKTSLQNWGHRKRSINVAWLQWRRI